MNRLAEKILAHPELRQAPPVLVDVGASSALPSIWQQIAAHAICVAVDADSREMGHVNAMRRQFRKFLLLDQVAHVGPETSVPFHLTRFPLCSSLLRPDTEALAEWSFSPWFEVDHVTPTPAVKLRSFLTEHGVGYVDWIKLDTQGTDLRLFDSLGDGICSRTLVAEFEPGIIDAYVGEDKMHEVMRSMGARDFWLAKLNLKGTTRIRRAQMERLNPMSRRFIHHLIKQCPCWGEMLYVRNMNSGDGVRERLLGWLFASMIGQHGYALLTASEGKAASGDPLFEELEACTLKSLRAAAWKAPITALRKKAASWLSQ